ISKEMHTFVQRMAVFRKNSKALTQGSFTQFVPRDGLYVYFRRSGEETIMVLFNGNDKSVTLEDVNPYQEMLAGYRIGEDITRGIKDVPIQGLELRGKETRVIKL
ncbi:MAG: cyclomaltodextrinase C-terminal domain-containing protein, partial [Lewinella sp.]